MLSKNQNQASQNGQNKVNSWSTPTRSILVVIIGIIWLFVIAQTARAVDFSSLNSFRKIETYKVRMSELSDIEEPKLDWRNPKMDLIFETPSSDWIEDLDFFVKIHAEGSVNQNVPVFIRFNNGEPTPIYARGNSFEARIELNTAEVRARRNVISIGFGHEKNCIDQTDGAFAVDMDDSFLVVKASLPSQGYYLSDARQVLQSTLTAPKTVAITAHGKNHLKYEALTAQGIVLNMKTLPRFTIGNSGDAQIFVGTRRELSSIINGSDIAHKKGPVLGITQNAPLRFVLTADNHEELDGLVKSFASREIPPVRRSYAYAGEFSWQNSFSVNNVAISGKKELFELGEFGFNRGLGNSAQIINFDVDNPLSADGTLKINFRKSQYVSNDSTVNISLNGERLGTSLLNAKRKKLKLDIPKGLLVGTDNILTISPELAPKQNEACYAQLHRPAFTIDANSYIKINSDYSGFTGDLTRLAASGYPFSNNHGEATAVVLATSSKTDKSAALRAFAHLGKVYGTGWINAEIYALSDLPEKSTKNVLFIGPKFDRNAPRALTATIEGRKNAPKIVQTASLNPDAISLLSIRSSVRGGVMGIFEDKNSQNIKGYITTARGASFSRAIDQIVEPKNWNRLQGSLARWNKSTVEMAQTAFNFDQINDEFAAEKVAKKEFQLSDITMPDFSWPDLSISEISIPDIDLHPIRARLDGAAKNTGEFFGDSWRGLKIAFRKITPTPKATINTPIEVRPMETTVETKTVSAPALELNPVLGRAPSSRIKPSVQPAITAQPTPKPVSERPFIASITTPTNTDFESVSRIQYKPGVSLRGLSNPEMAANLKPINVETRPQYKPKGLQIETPKTGVFSRVSGWMSVKLDGLMGSSTRASDSRKANLLVFAVALILLMLLLALARPRRD